MPDPTSEFFHMLREHGRDVLPAKLAQGSIRFDLDHGMETTHWFVQVERDNVIVSREKRPADCVAHCEARLFDQLVLGQAHLLAMALRNELTVEGDLAPLLLFRRALPSSPDARDPREFVRDRGQR